MITNFEEITKRLNDVEKTQLPYVIKILYGIRSPLKTPEVLALLSGVGVKITGVRLRKFINLIRSFGLVPVIGTSRGYYTSFAHDEIKKQIKSMRERADAINNAADGMEKFTFQKTLF